MVVVSHLYEEDLKEVQWLETDLSYSNLTLYLFLTDSVLGVLYAGGIWALNARS